MFIQTGFDRIMTEDKIIPLSNGCNNFWGNNTGLCKSHAGASPKL
jgi:hypothetical protein